ncbi:hypothetical protein [Glycomyces tritici]|uniref:Uncharacterized protein n=1 Tax=Glycomyces tritici TaxID=2665176 RepID=A0ABT7YXJ1_9ACTN|nr:hypothetical protein [Glycomyces tritici]MDN3243352.1 hypothetical protein [Glycomyces tritici]MDN3243771.1 hypothetical protein [Glycomyces tritici]
MAEGSFTGFARPAVPTPQEIREWALDPYSTAPEGRQWDLTLATDELVDTWLDLAADATCPKRSFALHVLYIYAGDAVRTNFRVHSRKRVDRLLEKAVDSRDQYVELWAANTKALIRQPDLFDYHEWCNGGLVRGPRRLRPGPTRKP